VLGRACSPLEALGDARELVAEGLGLREGARVEGRAERALDRVQFAVIGRRGAGTMALS
jgi:hypothetical protein